MKKTLLSILFLLGGAMVFIFGNPYYDVFPTNGNQTYTLAITIFFLILSLILKNTQADSDTWRAPYALFSASVALYFMNTGVLNIHVSSIRPVRFLAADKLSQFIHVVPILIGLAMLAKGNLKSIFISRGKLKSGLIFGLLSFVGFAVIGLMIAANSPDVFSSLQSAIPWLLIFVFSNAVMEELWFRGIFLKHYEKIIGRSAAILVTSLVFGLSHINATYSFPGGGLVFGLVVFGLGLVGACAMAKDESMIGPVLFHAGYDLLIIVPVLATV